MEALRAPSSVTSLSYIPKALHRNTTFYKPKLMNLQSISTENTPPPPEPELETDNKDEKFDWFSEWCPIMPVCDLDKRVPHGKKVLGIDIVVWWDKNESSWKVFDDACPHRLAPLSDGRIDKLGRLQCAYHGWCFNGSGHCKLVPQAPLDGPQVHTFKKACAGVYPCTVQHDIVWFWPNKDPHYKDIVKKKKPPYIPELDDPSLTRWFGNRDFPYGYEVLIENLLDPAHVPYAHYGIIQAPPPEVKIDREGGKPIELGVKKLDINGFIGKADWGGGNFIAPYIYHAYLAPTAYQGNESAATSTGNNKPQLFFGQKLEKPKVLFTFFCVPERKIMEIGPTNWQNSCFVPTASDAFVFGFRRWMNKYTGGQVNWGGKFSGTLPPTPPREQLMDRYWSHVVNCRSCNSAYKSLNALEVVLQVTSVVSIGIAAATKQSVMSATARTAVVSMGVVCFVASRCKMNNIYLVGLNRSIVYSNLEAIQPDKILMPVCELDKRVPHAKKILGIDVVVWWDRNESAWKVFDDTCPHRLAPLSQGRIDQWGRLQCVYHGWCFNGSGHCKFIPQAPPDGPPVHTFKKACVGVYPSTVQNEIVWFWPSTDPKYTDIVKKKKPPFIPELDDPSSTNSFMNRDFPYGYEVLVENLMDPAHVPYAHYGIMQLDQPPKVKVDREGGKPLEVSVKKLDTNGFVGRQEWGSVKFTAPCTFCMYNDLVDVQGNGSASLTRIDKERKIMEVGAANWQKACFVPTRLDALVVGFRRWLNKYRSHVVNCRSSSSAYMALTALEVTLQIISIVSIGIVAATKQNLMPTTVRTTVVAVAVVCFAASRASIAAMEALGVSSVTSFCIPTTIHKTNFTKSSRIPRSCFSSTNRNTSRSSKVFMTSLSSSSSVSKVSSPENVDDPPETELDKTGAKEEKFDWFLEWYPVMTVCELNKRVPLAKKILGLDVVVWWDRNESTWKVFDDACPHRLAPLSQGRIDQWGRLQCVYHGWCFNGSGHCKFIPQAPPDGPPVHTFKKACVGVYPTTVQHDTVWFWPSTDPKYKDIINKKKPPFIPELDDPSFTKFFINRDIPCGYEIVLENLMDPAHVPYAHYGIMQLDQPPRVKVEREGGKPLELSVKKLDVNGFVGRQEWGSVKFIAPCTFCMYADPEDVQGNASASSTGTDEVKVSPVKVDREGGRPLEVSVNKLDTNGFVGRQEWGSVKFTAPCTFCMYDDPVEVQGNGSASLTRVDKVKVTIFCILKLINEVFEDLFDIHFLCFLLFCSFPSTDNMWAELSGATKYGVLFLLYSS
ncbi:hypothetical protein JRO89_XS10G0005500 [Xanthoceras sorbifolium]|uniref:Rieske domain-containing protein n=1 Tax=Xanthoceras sorbifolium TaxID=99658 RepID=A0ABQ8HH12_9ROSI|nr:hypothetical protein JRO89_XS10G0005500 [Xanthoceras sorbifolium]